MHICDRGQKTVRKGQKHKVGRASVAKTSARMSTDVGFCPHCRGLRNMRATQVMRKGAGRDRDLTITHHCETCGLFVENEAFRKASWDELINSLNKFSADFMTERKQPKLQNRQDCRSEAARKALSVYDPICYRFKTLGTTRGMLVLTVHK